MLLSHAITTVILLIFATPEQNAKAKSEISSGSHRGCLQDIFNYHHLTLEIKVVLRASHIPFRSADRFQYLADLHKHYQWVLSDQLRQDEFQAFRVRGGCSWDPTCKLAALPRIQHVNLVCKTGEDATEHFLPTSNCYLGVAALCILLLAIDLN